MKLFDRKKSHSFDNLSRPASLYYQSTVTRDHAKGKKGDYRNTRTAPWKISLGNWGEPTAFKSERPYYISSLDDTGLRQVGYCDEILTRLGHQGWYCDHYLDETVRGHVLQLPSRNGDGSETFIPALVWSDRDGITLYPLDGYATKEECAAAADSYAQHAAEEERECAAKAQAEMDIENALESIEQYHGDFRRLIRERKQAPQLPKSIADTVSIKLSQLRDYVSDNIKTIRERRENFWTSVEGF